jgi:hypothetical protein
MIFTRNGKRYMIQSEPHSFRSPHGFFLFEFAEREDFSFWHSGLWVRMNRYTLP